jgi:hypothetical protein
MGRHLHAWALALALSPALAQAGEAAQAWQRLAGLEAPARSAQAGGRVSFEVDLSPETSPGFSDDATPAGHVLRYRMAFNQIAEGWSWRPESDPAREDYYRYKYLPLESVLEERGQYDNPNPFDGSHRIAVRWRYDYFLAFENIYEFYPRTADNDAGFAATVPAEARLPLRMRVTARLTEPVLAESTTYWRATPAKKEDFTLKKRYFFGALEEVSFVDAEGRTLAVLRAGISPETSGR